MKQEPIYRRCLKEKSESNVSHFLYSCITARLSSTCTHTAYPIYAHKELCHRINRKHTLGTEVCWLRGGGEVHTEVGGKHTHTQTHSVIKMVKNTLFFFFFFKRTAQVRCKNNQRHFIYFLFFFK